jgi:hypothetical protein
MPSFEHNGLVEMFRENPSLALLLLEQILHLPVPPHTSVAVVEAALDQLVPIEFRADLVIEVKHGDQVVFAIVLEVQLGEDPDKKNSWPVYLTVTRARRKGCPVCVLVVAPNAKVAAWAAKSIALGLPGDTIQPRVLGPPELPRVTDPAEVRRQPEIAVLSAMAHGNEPDGLEVVMAVLANLEGFDEARASVYRTLIYDALAESLRRKVDQMNLERVGPFQEPVYVQKLKAMGWEKGLEEGRAEGLEKGRAYGLKAALFKLIARAGLTLGEEERARIEGCDDPAVLDRWLDNAIEAKTAADLFQ